MIVLGVLTTGGRGTWYCRYDYDMKPGRLMPFLWCHFYKMKIIKSMYDHNFQLPVTYQLWSIPCFGLMNVWSKTPRITQHIVVEWRHMETFISVNIGSGNWMMPDDTKP